MPKLLLAAAALFLAAAPSRAAAPELYTEPGYFTVKVPAGWTQKEEGFASPESDRKVYGADFFGPQSGGLAVLAGARYYAPDNLLHSTPEKFIKLHSKPAIGVNLDGKVYGPVQQGQAGNYYAKVFERKTFEYLPKDAFKPKKIQIYEKFYVVPVKNGFFVLRYYAPMDLAKANLKAFEGFAASFKPLIR